MICLYWLKEVWYEFNMILIWFHTASQGFQKTMPLARGMQQLDFSYNMFAPFKFDCNLPSTLNMGIKEYSCNAMPPVQEIKPFFMMVHNPLISMPYFLLQNVAWKTPQIRIIGTKRHLGSCLAIAQNVQKFASQAAQGSLKKTPTNGDKWTNQWCLCVYASLSIQICPRKGIEPWILLKVWEVFGFLKAWLFLCYKKEGLQKYTNKNIQIAVYMLMYRLQGNITHKKMDASKSLHKKWLFHQTSIKKWLFRVPG